MVNSVESGVEGPDEIRLKGIVVVVAKNVVKIEVEINIFVEKSFHIGFGPLGKSSLNVAKFVESFKSVAGISAYRICY